MREQSSEVGHRHRPTRGRLRALFVLALGMAGIVAVSTTTDQLTDPAAPAAVGSTPEQLTSVAPPDDALGSTWFCAGGSGEHYVVIENPTARDLTATLTTYLGALDTDDAGAAAAAATTPAVEEVQVPSRGRTDVRVDTAFESATFTATLVEVTGGTVAVEHTVVSDEGEEPAPCASASSPTWYLAAGATTRDASELLAVFNPFADDAVLDLTFTTTEGFRAPQEYEGFVIPGGRLAVLDIGAVVSRHAQVSASIVARSGRVVVDRLQAFDSSAGPAGVALTPAMPQPANLWYFPEGLVGDGIIETVSVYNPGDRQAEVDVELTLADPGVNGAVEPFGLSIPPRSFAQVNLSAESRIPPGVGHSIAVRSVSDANAPVVAERWIRAGAPAGRTGFSATIGSPVVASAWLLPVGSTRTGIAESIVVLNPSTDSIARISVAALTGGQVLDIDGLQDLEIPAAGRVAVDLGSHVNRDTLPLVVNATIPVVVERGFYRGDGFGLSQSIAIPVADTATVARRI